MSVLRQWNDLPDPREPHQGKFLTVVLTVNGWAHCSKHWLSPREPWKEEFGADVVNQITPVLPSSPPWPAFVESVLQVLYRQTKECLERPQAIVAEAVRERARAGIRKGRFNTWILVLPSGAMAILRGSGLANRWVTCYFPDPAAVKKSRKDRWQATVRELIKRYVLIPRGDPAVALPSQEMEVVRKERQGQLVRLRKLRFLTPETWGFRPDLRGCPWRGRLPSWPAAEAPEEKPTKKRRLKPRFNWEREEELEWRAYQT